MWDVEDFAEFIGESHKVAKARLQTFNSQMNGMLLIPSSGQNRRWTFSPALLAKAIDDGRLAQASGLFDSLDSLEMRVDTLEDRVSDVQSAQKIIATQTGDNTRRIAKLERKKRVA